MQAKSVEVKNKVLCEGIYNHFASKYGVYANSTRPVSHSRKHNRPIKKITREKNDARKALRKAKREGEETGIIQALARKFHSLIRLHSKTKKEQLKTQLNLEARKARRECAKSFWRFAAKVLDGEGDSVAPSFSVEEAERYFREVYSSNRKEFQRPEWLPAAELPQSGFNDDPFSATEISGVLRRARSSSSPSPIDRVSYQILKRCPSLLSALVDLYNTCWDSAAVPLAWKQGVISLIPKEAATSNPSEPSNFRPIALTSCVGKVFTSILRNRWLNYMVANHFLDTNIQKAFVKNIPGCTEQYSKLLAAVQEAFKKHKFIAVCWLDLANAYGSVHHGLIDFALQHFHAPPQFRSVVANLYTDLNVIVTSPSWVTTPIPFQIGVYQGDPLSVVIFNSVMSTLAESLKQLKGLGYKFSNSSRSLSVLQYADDTCLVADGPASCHELLNRVEQWLQWTGMKAKVPKCHSLAIQASSSRSYDPKLMLQGGLIPYIGSNAIKFLGAFIQVPPNHHQHREHLKSKLMSLMGKVDGVPVTRGQKLRLYKAAICPRVLWDLGISDYPVSWVSSCLEALVTRYLKRWSGLSRSADPSRLYLPRKNGGLDLPNITTLYRKVRVNNACQLLMSHDPITQQVAKLHILKEEGQQRAKFHPMLRAREVMADDPGARRKTIMRRAKISVEIKDAEGRLHHAKGLAKQGELHLFVVEDAAALWSKVVQELPPESMKFALNAAQDTLPHNANLAVWRHEAGLSSQCKLCGQRQTLLHVLNHCPVALDMRRYNERHDMVLQVIFKFLSKQSPESHHVIADLPLSTYTFPTAIALTDLRPDLVLWSDTLKEVTLVELTVCYETNFADAVRRKTEKYQDLVEACEENGYTTQLLTLEVGSRGFLNMDGFLRLFSIINISKQEKLSFIKSIGREAIISSHKIWVTRNSIT